MEIYSDVYKQNILTNIDLIFITSILQNKLWEGEIVYKISNLLEDNTDVLDIGASIGLISLGINLHNNNKNHKIHCFECNVESFIKLKYNTKSHKNIDIYNFGLGNNLLLGNMSTSTFNNGISFIKNEYSEECNKEISYDCFKTIELNNVLDKNIFCAIIRLDDIRYMFKRRVSIIKVDIEGYEKNFLLGAKEFIQEHKPYIFIEIFNELQDEVFKLLECYNYKLIENIKNIYQEKSIDFLFGPV